MSHATTAFNVDENGYLLVTDAAACQLVTHGMVIDNSTTPTPIPQDQSAIPMNLVGRRRIYIRNYGEHIVWIGNRDVTITTGYPIPVNEEVVLDITDAIQLYAIIDGTDDVDLRTLEIA